MRNFMRFISDLIKHSMEENAVPITIQNFINGELVASGSSRTSLSSTPRRANNPGHLDWRPHKMFNLLRLRPRKLFLRGQTLLSAVPAF